MRLVKSGVSTNVTHALVDGLGGTYRMDYTDFLRPRLIREKRAQ
jgi:hypothetical protein